MASSKTTKQQAPPRGAEKATAVPAGVDRVAIPSVRADGEPDQTPDYEVIDQDED